MSFGFRVVSGVPPLHFPTVDIGSLSRRKPKSPTEKSKGLEEMTNWQPTKKHFISSCNVDIPKKASQYFLWQINFKNSK